jgi:hypothetical protein
MIIGSERKKRNTTVPTAAGTHPSSGLLGPERMPLPTPTPASTKVMTLAALVSRNSTAERSATRVGFAPRSTSSHAPTATLPAPPSDTAALKASSESATRAPRRTGARSNTCKKAIT